MRGAGLCGATAVAAAAAGRRADGGSGFLTRGLVAAAAFAEAQSRQLSRVRNRTVYPKPWRTCTTDGTASPGLLALRALWQGWRN